MLFPNRDNLRSRMLIFTGKLLRTKDPNAPDEGGGTTNAQQIGTKPQLQKCLTTLDLTSLGVGSCVGTGMYLVAGIVASHTAGPGVILSFIVAAMAALFSGVCYAEFGVRVPHTTGSAYMYSYVTVGEFIAFVIGWNMILEYLIGTAAGACAISACIDSLAGGAISKAIEGAMGTLMGHTPDVLGAFITLLMTVVLIAGVKKSLMFNNVLNAVNLAVWIFIMTAGCFYADTSNWSAEHGGFLPMGWSGVLSGAATCFYAFIGFDIIATTGEEARDPRWSIPLAIILSLVIILTAYISSSVMMTLVLPFDELHDKSALVDMFGQRGATKSQIIVAIGAMAGLTVSMFGSMFPMPRIVYAMAKDGLIFRTLSNIWTFVGTPALATAILGVLTSIVSLLIGLDVLVEMMSIGTLMAYTLVSTCVLLLRYQPVQQTTLVDLLPESIRSACPTPSRELPPTLPTLPTSVPGLGLGSTSATNPLAGNTMNRITIRAKTRMDSSESEGSPSSPVDTQPPWVPTNDTGTKGGSSNYDGKSLVMDEATASPDGIMGEGGISGSAPSGFLGRSLRGVVGVWSELRLQIRSHLKVLSYRCPGLFFWHRRPGSATEETGRYVIKLVGFLYFLIITFDLVAVIGANGLADGSWFPSLLLYSCLAGIFTVIVLIARQPQNRCDLKFKAPYVPLVPAIAVLVNIYLIFRLSYLTLIRFCIWMAFGLLMYFCYGIKHSSLEDYYTGGAMAGSTSGGPYYNDTAMGIELQIPNDRLSKQGPKPPADERTPINGDLNRLGVGGTTGGQMPPPQLPQRSQRSPSSNTPASVGRRWETFD